MPKYTYRARDAEGNLTRGTLRAGSEERASNLLRSHNLTPVGLQLAEKESLLKREVFKKVGTRDLIMFFRHMSSMIQAGVPIVEALKAIEKQVDSNAFAKELQEMVYDIEAGESLSTAMSKHPKTHNPFSIGVVRAGEASGRLSSSLQSISDYFAQNYAFNRRVRAALTYPIFVLGLVIILSIVMFTAVLPQLVAVFADAGVELPLPTRILIGITTFMQRFWPVVVISAVAVGLLIRSYIRTPEGSYTVSTYLLKLPVISTLFQKLYLARLTSVLHTLFSSDVPVLESLSLARQSVGNKVYRRILNDTIKSIQDGASISVVWQYEPFIPPLLTSMVSVGERSGEVANAFKQASDFFKEDVDQILDSLAVLLEPILIVVLGIGVALVVAAVLLPIYNLVLVL